MSRRRALDQGELPNRSTCAQEIFGRNIRRPGTGKAQSRLGRRRSRYQLRLRMPAVFVQQVSRRCSERNQEIIIRVCSLTIVVTAIADRFFSHRANYDTIAIPFSKQRFAASGDVFDSHRPAQLKETDAWDASFRWDFED